MLSWLLSDIHSNRRDSMIRICLVAYFNSFGLRAVIAMGHRFGIDFGKMRVEGVFQRQSRTTIGLWHKLCVRPDDMEEFRFQALQFRKQVGVEA